MKLRAGLLVSFVVASLVACSDDTGSGGSGAGSAGGAAQGGAAEGGSGGANMSALAVDAGPDLTLQLPTDHVSLLAVVSGTEATGATVLWTQTSGTPATLSGASTPALDVSGLVVGVYVFEVVASAAGGDTASDEVTVTVASDATLCPGPRFYVSPGGSDSSGDGSQAAPWASLAKATQSVTTAGATIELAAGDYLESEQSQLAPGVCVEGQGDSTVIKSTLTADWTPILHAVSEEGTDGHQHISKLKLDGQALSTFWAIEVAGRSNVSIHDVTVVDFKDRGVIMNGRADNLEAPPTIYATGLSFYNNTVLNSAAYDLPTGVYGRGALNLGGTEGMLVYNNVMTQNQRPIGQNGWLIKGSNEGYNKGLKIFHNKLTKIPFTGSFGGDGGWDFAVEMFHDQGTEFYDNVVDGAGFDTNHQSKGDYAYSVWIHDNVFTLPEVVNANNTAVTLEFSTDAAIVEDNVIDNMSGCLLFTPRPGDTITDVTFAGNLCTHVSKGAGDGSNADFVNMAPGGTDYSVDGLFIYNNTFLADPNNRPWWGIELGGPSVGTITNVEIKNNLIAHTVSGGIVGGDNLQLIDISNNDIFDVVATTDPVFPGAAPTGLTYANNLHVDPLFVSASDFHLQVGSPAIDAGVDVGRPFNGAAPDLGYAEH